MGQRSEGGGQMGHQGMTWEEERVSPTVCERGGDGLTLGLVPSQEGREEGSNRVHNKDTEATVECIHLW